MVLVVLRWCSRMWSSEQPFQQLSIRAQSPDYFKSADNVPFTEIVHVKACHSGQSYFPKFTVFSCQRQAHRLDRQAYASQISIMEGGDLATHRPIIHIASDVGKGRKGVPYRMIVYRI